LLTAGAGLKASCRSSKDEINKQISLKNFGTVVFPTEKTTCT